MTPSSRRKAKKRAKAATSPSKASRRRKAFDDLKEGPGSFTPQGGPEPRPYRGSAPQRDDMPYFLVPRVQDASLGVAEYGACKRCSQSTLMCPTTQTEDGLVCPDCLLAGYRARKAKAPVTGRIEQLERERDELQRRLGQIGREVAALRAQLRRQTDYSR